VNMDVTKEKMLESARGYCSVFPIQLLQTKVEK